MCNGLRDLAKNSPRYHENTHMGSIKFCAAHLMETLMKSIEETQLCLDIVASMQPRVTTSVTSFWHQIIPRYYFVSLMIPILFFHSQYVGGRRWCPFFDLNDFQSQTFSVGGTCSHNCIKRTFNHSFDVIQLVVLVVRNALWQLVCVHLTTDRHDNSVSVIFVALAFVDTFRSWYHT